MIHLPFTSEKFIETWELWKLYRKEIRKPYKGEISEQAALMKLSRYNESEAIEMIMQSIENSWQGIFEIKKQYNGQTAKTNVLDRAKKLFE